MHQTESQSMYEQVMGASFGRLAQEVQQFHQLAGKHVLHGRVEIQAPTTKAAYLLSFFLGTPRSAEAGKISFELRAKPAEETWTRHFPSKTMSSHLQLINGQLIEKLGFARLVFALSENDGQLMMHLQRLHFFGIPCPSWLMPRVRAEETGRDGRLYFYVSAEVPGAGLVAAYQGYLTLPVSAIA